MYDEVSRGLAEHMEFDHEQNCTTENFGKAPVHLILPQLKYAGHPMHNYIAMWEPYAAPLAFMDAWIHESLLMTILTVSFIKLSKLPYGQEYLHRTSHRI